MNIYLGYSSKNISIYYKDYTAVHQIIRAQGGVLTYVNLEKIYKKDKELKGKFHSTDTHYHDIIRAIDKAEICIFMANEETMSLGYQIMYAVSRKKNSLVLACRDNDIDIEHVFIAGSGSAYLDFKSYANTKDLEKYIQRFITKSSKQTKARLSLHLEKPLYDALVSRAKEEGRTKSEMLEILVAEKKQSLEKYKK